MGGKGVSGSGEALLLIDALNGFMHPKGSLYCETAKEVVPKMREVLDGARLYKVPVFYLNDAHKDGDMELQIWGSHAMKGTWEAKVIAELAPRSESEIIEKRWYSGFTGTDLDARLKMLGVRDVYITGMHTNICDRHTSYDALVCGYGVAVVSDATGTFTPEEHKVGLDYLKKMYAARIVTAEEAVKGFAKRSAATARG